LIAATSHFDIEKCDIAIRKETRDEPDVCGGRCEIVFLVERLALGLDEILPKFTLQANAGHFHRPITDKMVSGHE